MESSDGEPTRFCQQCGRFQLLGDFDGMKKTCRRKLEMHNAQRKRKREENREQHHHSNQSREGSPVSGADSGIPVHPTRRQILPSFSPMGRSNATRLHNQLGQCAPNGSSPTAIGVPPPQLAANFLEEFSIDELISGLGSEENETTGVFLASSLNSPVVILQAPSPVQLETHGSRVD